MKSSSVIRTLLLSALLFGAPLAACAETTNAVTAAAEFVGLLAKQDFPGCVARFDATMKGALPEAKLREVWQTLGTQAGPFKKQLRTRAEKYGGYDIIFVTCQFEKTTLDAKVVFDAKRQVAGLFFVPSRAAPGPETLPSYVRTNSFQEKAVKVGAGEWTLPGTLTLPVRPGPWPGVVLVHGSGPLDRDETIGPNKPFRDLAWGLATRGIAVLRYEKRTKEHPAKVLAAGRLTVKEETIDDALSAVALLRHTAGIDSRHLFVLGHSLGGLVAPRIGQADPAIAGLIVLAGSTRPLEDLMVEQTRYILSVEGKMSPAAESKLAELQAQVARVKKLTSADATNSALVLGAPAAYWLDLRSYDAVATARALQQRMLILQGGRDYQVTEADFDGWKQGLAARSNVTFKLFPDLNHLFMSGQGKSTPAEYEQAGHVAGAVVDVIAEWVFSQTPQ
jgi:uncharacterized protein